MEAARMLINRATLRIADYPGTCAFRRSTIMNAANTTATFCSINEEIIRHLRSPRLSHLLRQQLLHPQTPPKFRKWLEATSAAGLRRFRAAFPKRFCSHSSSHRPCHRHHRHSATCRFFSCRSCLRRSDGPRQCPKIFPAQHLLLCALWIFRASAQHLFGRFIGFSRAAAYPFGDRLLSKGIGPRLIEGGKLLRAN